MHNNLGRAPARVDVSQHATRFPLMILGVAMAAILVACSPAAVATVAPTPAPTASPASPAPTATAEPTATPAPLPTPAPSTTAGTACAPADLKASHGRVEGAAGSRLTTVLLTSASACSIDAFPALGLRGAGGAILVGAASSGPGRIDLAAGGVYEANVRLANWCADQPDFPLALEIVLGADELPVTGGSFPEQGDLPPCNGDGGPVLEATGWSAAP